MTHATFAIAVTFEIKPEHVDSFRRRVIQQAQDSVQKEPGCLQFDVLVDETNAGIIVLYETYIDASAFEDHRKTAHFADFNQTVAPWVENKQVRRLMLVDGNSK